MTFSHEFTEAQRAYAGPDQLKLLADFLPHVGEFVLMFPKIERQVTWAVEAFTGATRWDGNELEGLIQNFSSRIKILDIVSRPKCRSDAANEIRTDIVSRLKSLNAFRNKLIHNPTTGIRRTLDPKTNLYEIAMMLKLLEPNTGAERSGGIALTELQSKPAEMVELIQDIRSWTHSLCPEARKEVP